LCSSNFHTFISLALVVTLDNNDDDNDDDIMIMMEDQTNLNFLVVGDWGGKSDSPYYTRAQKDVAHQMGEKAEKINSQFTVGLGDNFYDYGVTDVDDPRFNTTFEVSMYICALLHEEGYQ